MERPRRGYAFQLWIKAEHPDDVLVLYTDDSQGSRRFTEDALQVWEQRTQEYVQAVLTSREAYAADVAAICTTRAPQLAEVAVPTDGALDQVAADNTAAAAVLQQTYDGADRTRRAAVDRHDDVRWTSAASSSASLTSPKIRRRRPPPAIPLASPS